MRRMRIGALAIVGVLGVCAPPPTDAQAPPRASSPMVRLRAAFLGGRVARTESLEGTWLQTKSVVTERYRSGRTGPDHVTADPEGIFRPDVHGDSVAWMLRFAWSPLSQLFVTSEAAWTWGFRQAEAVDFSHPGEFRFFDDDGADEARPFRCRAATSRRLVCLQQHAENAYGVEFTKVGDSTGAKAKPAMDLPLAGQSVSMDGWGADLYAKVQAVDSTHPAKMHVIIEGRMQVFWASGANPGTMEIGWTGGTATGTLAVYIRNLPGQMTFTSDVPNEPLELRVLRSRNPEAPELVVRGASVSVVRDSIGILSVTARGPAARRF